MNEPCVLLYGEKWNWGVCFALLCCFSFLSFPLIERENQLCLCLGFDFCVFLFLSFLPSFLPRQLAALMEQESQRLCSALVLSEPSRLVIPSWLSHKSWSHHNSMISNFSREREGERDIESYEAQTGLRCHWAFTSHRIPRKDVDVPLQMYVWLLPYNI